MPWSLRSLLKKRQEARSVVQVVERLASNLQVLSSNPVPQIERERERWTVSPFALVYHGTEGYEEPGGTGQQKTGQGTLPLATSSGFS
jgi:hypothetical protein